jgi:hypothetical protein
MVPGAEAGRPVLLVYDAALIALAVGLLVALLLASWERTTLTDLVVELAADRARSVEASLARALGDDTLQVGYWKANTAVTQTRLDDRSTCPARTQVEHLHPSSGRAPASRYSFTIPVRQPALALASR